MDVQIWSPSDFNPEMLSGGGGRHGPPPHAGFGIHRYPQYSEETLRGAMKAVPGFARELFGGCADFFQVKATTPQLTVSLFAADASADRILPLSPLQRLLTLYFVNRIKFRPPLTIV